RAHGRIERGDGAAAARARPHGDRSPSPRAPRRSAPPARPDRGPGARPRGALRVVARADRAARRHDGQPGVADDRPAHARLPRLAAPGRDASAAAARSREHRSPDRRRARRHRRRSHRGRGRRHPAHPASRRRDPDRARAAPKPGDERNQTMSDFMLDTPTQEPDLASAMKVVYQWNYGSEVEERRRLYVKAAEAQWVAERDIDWDLPIDLRKFASTPTGGSSLAMERNSYWLSLPEET